MRPRAMTVTRNLLQNAPRRFRRFAVARRFRGILLRRNDGLADAAREAHRLLGVGARAPLLRFLVPSRPRRFHALTDAESLGGVHRLSKVRVCGQCLLLAFARPRAHPPHPFCFCPVLRSVTAGALPVILQPNSEAGPPPPTLLL